MIQLLIWGSRSRKKNMNLFQISNTRNQIVSLSILAQAPTYILIPIIWWDGVLETHQKFPISACMSLIYKYVHANKIFEKFSSDVHLLWQSSLWKLYTAAYWSRKLEVFLFRCLKTLGLFWHLNCWYFFLHKLLFVKLLFMNNPLCYQWYSFISVCNAAILNIFSMQYVSYHY